MTLARKSSAFLAVLALLLVASCSDESSTLPDPVEGVDAAPPDDPCAEDLCEDPDQIVLPLRVHILRSEVDALDAQITAEEVTERLELVNDIWAQANIAFELEGVHYPQSQNEETFLDVAGAGEKGPEALAAVSAVIPEDELLRPGWNLVFIQSMLELPVGVYLAPKQVALVGVTEPSGGKTSEPLLSHELGHSLGLAHVADDGVSDNYLNLMCSGEGCSLSREERNLLTEDQITDARDQASTGDSILP